MADVLARIRASMPPLAGVVHAAGVRDDALVVNQTSEHLRRVMAPKVAGTWNLHTLTVDDPLDFMVFFGSAASVLGSPGQANYAAANAFLDAVAHHRRSVGLQALSVDWGPWAGAGMAVDASDEAQRRMRASGVLPIAVADGLAVLEQALREGRVQLVALPVAWAAFAERLVTGRDPRLLEDVLESTGRSSSEYRDALVHELEALPPEKRQSRLESRINDHVTRVLGFDESEPPDIHRPLMELGLDSLMAVELGNLVSRTVGVALPPTILFDYPTIEALAGYLLAQLLPTDEVDDAGGDPGGQRELIVAEVETLSDDEAEALINESLAKLLPRPGGSG
jgi:myxalamid-type polyketide synthase MxaB